MRKFRKYIYINDDLLADFINQIPELSISLKSIEKEQLTSINGIGGIPIAKINSELKENTKTISENIVNNAEKFILWCENKDNSINMNINIPKSNDKGVICIVSGKSYLPNKVQDFELLESFKSNYELMSTINGISQDDISRTKLLKDSLNIPILMDISDNYIVNFLVLKKSLKEDINDFYESLDEDLTIICRLDNIYTTGKIEIFDIAKECLKINRTVRRRMNIEQLANVVVYEDSPLIKITPLIIYK